MHVVLSNKKIIRLNRVDKDFHTHFRDFIHILCFYPAIVMQYPTICININLYMNGDIATDSGTSPLITTPICDINFDVSIKLDSNLF